MYLNVCKCIIMHITIFPLYVLYLLLSSLFIEIKILILIFFFILGNSLLYNQCSWRSKKSQSKNMSSINLYLSPVVTKCLQLCVIIFNLIIVSIFIKCLLFVFSPPLHSYTTSPHQRIHNLLSIINTHR